MDIICVYICHPTIRMTSQQARHPAPLCPTPLVFLLTQKCASFWSPPLGWRTWAKRKPSSPAQSLRPQLKQPVSTVPTQIIIVSCSYYRHTHLLPVPLNYQIFPQDLNRHWEGTRKASTVLTGPLLQQH